MSMTIHDIHVTCVKDAKVELGSPDETVTSSGSLGGSAMGVGMSKVWLVSAVFAVLFYVILGHALLIHS